MPFETSAWSPYGDALHSRFLIGSAGYPSPQVLRESIAAAGAQATGEIVGDDPLPALRAAVAADPSVTSVVVVTDPHAIEDTFRQDWASKARDALDLPVLHLYRGTSMLG